ncbi:MAG TPA: hypothetical protein VMT47_11340 [Polyangia bacterium]|nr:hypothetical protein [Polyangia bacterium]
MRVRTVLHAFCLLSLFALVASALTIGCSSTPAKPLGGEGAACYADNRCNAQLTCVAQVCIKPGPGSADGAAGAGGTDAGGGADGAGAGGKDAGGGADGAAGADASGIDVGAADAPTGDAGTDGPPGDGGDAALPRDGGTDAPTPGDGSDAGDNADDAARDGGDA